jgi:hypothetical protein
MKPWKDFSAINLVFNKIEKYLEKSTFSFGSVCCWASKENEQKAKSKEIR